MTCLAECSVQRKLDLEQSLFLAFSNIGKIRWHLQVERILENQFYELGYLVSAQLKYVRRNKLVACLVDDRKPQSLLMQNPFY